MVKKTFSVTLDEQLVKQLEKRAKRDFLSVQELINKILWRSAKSSLRTKNYKLGDKEKFIKIFSRYKPYSKNSNETYYCSKCRTAHKYKSKIGKKHLKYSK